jgi:glycosyltransferase involved in cell wall biosynthesis
MMPRKLSLPPPTGAKFPGKQSRNPLTFPCAAPFLSRVARIHIIIAGHLAMSPRGQREAAALQAAGHNVTMSGIGFDPALTRIDRELVRRRSLRYSPALDVSAEEGRRHLSERARGLWARGLFRVTGRITPALLGYGVAEQLREARRIDADLTIVHGEAGLWIARELLRDGRRVGVDFEDWFSRDLPPAERHARPAKELARLEKILLQKAAYRIASSHAMARALAAAYGVSEPSVVTNAGQERAPQTPQESSTSGDEPLRLHWFSQTIGPARGLELLVEALPLVRHPVRVTLRGACRPKNRAWLERIIPVSCRSMIAVARPVPPWQLAECVAEHHVGLALETSAIPSRDVCITNKFFQYFASGLAVIATDTQGQREALAPCPEAGTLLAEASPQALAEAIDAYAADPDRLARARRAAHAAADGPWNGVREHETLVAEADRALGSAMAAVGERCALVPSK